MGKGKIGLYCYLTRYFDKRFTEMFSSFFSIVVMATESLKSWLKKAFIAVYSDEQVRPMGLWFLVLSIMTSDGGSTLILPFTSKRGQSVAQNRHILFWLDFYRKDLPILAFYKPSFRLEGHMRWWNKLKFSPFLSWHHGHQILILQTFHCHI